MKPRQAEETLAFECSHTVTVSQVKSVLFMERQNTAKLSQDASHMEQVYTTLYD